MNSDPAVGFRMEAAKDADKRLKDKKWIVCGASICIFLSYSTLIPLPLYLRILEMERWSVFTSCDPFMIRTPLSCNVSRDLYCGSLLCFPWQRCSSVLRTCRPFSGFSVFTRT